MNYFIRETIKSLIAVSLITLCVIVGFFIYQAYHAANNFDFEYTNELKERTNSVEVVKTIEIKKAISVSAYNLLTEQTDENPCESASGINICINDFDEFDWFEPFDHLPEDGWSSHSMGVIACPSYYPFYTEEKMLFQFGFDIMGEYYICLDRMAERYRNDEYYDVLFQGDNAKQRADEFGRKYNVEVKIYK